MLCCMKCKPCLFVQIDLRYTNPEEGGLEVVVAPVMRFKDIEFNANVKIEEIAPPERIISGFALEIFGAPLQVCLHLSLLPDLDKGSGRLQVPMCYPSACLGSICVVRKHHGNRWLI